MWKDVIASITNDYKLSPPATEAEIAQAEEKLGVTFPRELRSFLLESNGLRAHYGTPLIWPIERIISENVEFRTTDDYRDLYMPFDCLLFFGGSGNGDCFAYRITRKGVDGINTYLWDHEMDSRVWYAPSIERCLRTALTFEDEE